MAKPCHGLGENNNPGHSWHFFFVSEWKQRNNSIIVKNLHYCHFSTLIPPHTHTHTHVYVKIKWYKRPLRALSDSLIHTSTHSFNKDLLGEANTNCSGAIRLSDYTHIFYINKQCSINKALLLY